MQAIEKSEASTPADSLFFGLTRRQAYLLGAILLATLAMYLPSLRNGWVFDDWDEFVDNKLIGTWSFVWNSFTHDSWWFKDPRNLPQSVYYRPLENTWFALNMWIFGNHPAAWHLAKIALHLIAVILCFRAAQLLTGDVAIAMLCAAIFAVMPAQVESVIWASAIPEPMSTIFELGALVCVIGRSRAHPWPKLAMATALYALATLSHETAILFPAIVVAYVFLIEAADAGFIRRCLRALAIAAPFIAVAALYLGLRVVILGPKYAFTLPHPLTVDEVRGWSITVAHPSAMSYVLTLPAVLLEYLVVLVVPGTASPVHAVDWITQPSATPIIEAIALAAIVLTATILAWRSRDRRLYAFCAAASMLALLPAMNLNSIWALVQDRYLYMPAFGWSLAFAVATVRIASESRSARTAIAGAMAVLLAAYMVTSIGIEQYWHDNVTYFGQCLAADPDHLAYRLKLAAAMNKAHDYEDATRTLEVGVKLYPEDAYLRLKLAQQYQMVGRVADFQREFQKFNELSEADIERQRAAEESGASAHAVVP